MKWIIFIVFPAIVLSGCKKNNGNNGTNGTSGSFTVKYELTCSAGTTIKIVNGLASFGYTNVTGQVEYDNAFSSGSLWTKSLTVTTTQRPLQLVFEAISATLTDPGFATGSIYINGTLKATSTYQVSTPNGVVVMLLNHTVY